MNDPRDEEVLRDRVYYIFAQYGIYLRQRAIDIIITKMKRWKIRSVDLEEIVDSLEMTLIPHSRSRLEKFAIVLQNIKDVMPLRDEDLFTDDEGEYEREYGK